MHQLKYFEVTNFNKEMRQVFKECSLFEDINLSVQNITNTLLCDLDSHASVRYKQANVHSLRVCFGGPDHDQVLRTKSCSCAKTTSGPDPERGLQEGGWCRPSRAAQRGPRDPGAEPQWGSKGIAPGSS